MRKKSNVSKIKKQIKRVTKKLKKIDSRDVIGCIGITGTAILVAHALLDLFSTVSEPVRFALTLSITVILVQMVVLYSTYVYDKKAK